MGKHTPGPWHRGEGNGEGHIFANAEGKAGRMRFESGRGTTLYPICAMVTGWEAAEDAANAALVAEAPALLDVLRDAEAAIKYAVAAANTEADYDRLCAIQDRARALLARLDGAA